MSLPTMSPVASTGLQHYETLLELTGSQYRFNDGRFGVGVVLGMLDARTGCLPIGLVNGKRRYYANVLYYDANRRCLDVGDADYWSEFVGSYVGGGWLLKLVTGLGGATLTVVGAVFTTAIQAFTFFLVPALLFGLVGMLVYAFLGYTLYLTVMLALPYLLGGIAAYVVLCLLLAFVQSARQRRAGQAIETLLTRQLMSLFG
ncbi:hypothetical protein [Methylobacterium sp. E-045]|uniref:hypothetical protein n=1 Tax=Methylobacterium sp. E-045 TaxID=2836575 RepID=UPI001FB888A4|nr:hypothetical protein [Methylobacterium sp. E-045]MCJ2127514.1 hypothetical protein [Methylobacterium sp. E-045]